ncbi:tyrosine-type recombinase/integrase [Brevibacillus porteri]|uniref:Integrase n=1 Tax=Brevibacillus porteri TaxID=2126350 RepID=A0ABX5FH84_9BACL|nr:tyrosine-type recombinase/integrase [Brevibacillus porteri]MED1802000.1 tyrosine-type recombinase/integrase [Brevibacillus porteri]MED2132561.1 tyrosine-type recombinase/integrase [Brevibacillus porteri]MED2745441.1 tyrosine-type recombinase/integrase [Brevibacillus porteri]MED2814282.1 tyrosine-type recombinase/integrase [Brevibacillus porteri]MED2892531.1 tyrosine-type recombinase/integrase [Brevibacillus porteri]
METGTESRKGKRIVLQRGKASSGDISTLRESQTTIQEAFELFVCIKEAENVKPRTKSEYYVQYRYFVDWLQEQHSEVLYVQDVSTTLIRSYINYLAYDKEKYEGIPYRSAKLDNQKGLSPYTINIRIRFLKCWFNVLVKEKLVLDSPVKNIKLMKVDIDVKEPLSEDEVRLLLQQPNQRQYAQYRDYVMLMLFIDSGMRVQEVCALDVEDIDLATRCVHLPASKNKNRKSRVIPLSVEVIRLLQELITETRQYFETNTLFVSNFGERLTPDGIRTNIKKYAKRAGLRKTVSPHAFRRFYAKYSALNGMDLFSLQRILGHSDLATTRRYVQLNNEDLVQQHNQYSPLSNVLTKKKRGY